MTCVGIQYLNFPKKNINKVFLWRTLTANARLKRVSMFAIELTPHICSPVIVYSGLCTKGRAIPMLASIKKYKQTIIKETLAETNTTERINKWITSTNERTKWVSRCSIKSHSKQKHFHMKSIQTDSRNVSATFVNMNVQAPSLESLTTNGQKTFRLSTFITFSHQTLQIG